MNAEKLSGHLGRTVRNMAADTPSLYIEGVRPLSVRRNKRGRAPKCPRNDMKAAVFVSSEARVLQACWQNQRAGGTTVTDAFRFSLNFSRKQEPIKSGQRRA
jgi:hypothetical protein